MNFGMPYKGSKNRIAQKIIDFLPPAEHFYDLFGGGGAMTHCAVMSGKYKHVHYNELDPLVFKGFKMAVNGEFKNENRWISREDFFKLKDTDPYVAICFSFGNSMRTYAYNQNTEPFKKAVHYSICFDDNSLLNKYIDTSKLSYTTQDLHERRIHLQHYLKNFIPQIKNFCRHDNNNPRCILPSMEGLERLSNDICDISKYCNCDSENPRNVLQSKNIVCTNLSYDELDFETDSVIYCDPPYKNTSSYKINFNHEEFYDWCRKQKNIFISEYNMPNDFVELLNINKGSTFAQNIVHKTTEKLFTNHKTFELLNCNNHVLW